MAAALEHLEEIWSSITTRRSVPAELVGADLDPQAGWVLRFSLPAGRMLELIASTRADEVAARSVNFGFYYRAIEGSRFDASTRAFGAKLCEAFAALDVQPLAPEDVETPTLEPESGSIDSAGSVADQRRTETFGLPGVCDRDCVFCVGKSELRAFAEQRKESMSSLALARVDDDRATMRARLRGLAPDAEAVRISWSGMDCLASPLFDELLELAHELGFRNMHLQSPGPRLCEPGFVAYLIEHGIGEVHVTAHGYSDATFDASAGRTGAAALFWSALEVLEPSGLSIAIEVPIHRGNVREIPDLFARLADSRARVASFFALPMIGFEATYAEYGLDYPTLLRALEEARRRVPSREMAISAVPWCVLGPELADHFLATYDALNHVVDPRAFAHVESCEGCRRFEDCPGPPRAHVELFGSDRVRAV